MEPALIVHGGAYNIKDERVSDNIRGVCNAVRQGYQLLQEGKSCLDAVVAAVTSLEDDPTFDAGHGSVLNIKGDVEMDCFLMRGSDLKACSILGAKTVCNPIQLAHKLMNQQSVQTSVIGDAADKMALEFSLPTTTTDKLITEEAVNEWKRLTQFKETVDDVFRGRSYDESSSEPCDTTGCVAIDRHGNIACGTSTGGITAKLVGRVGDSPLIGCGGYCDDNIGGVSTTGHGEAITKVNFAYEVIENIKKGMKPEKAIEAALSYMDGMVEGGHGGAIAIDRFGNIGMHFNTPRMVWASMKNNELTFGINSEDHPFTTSSSVCPSINANQASTSVSQRITILCESSNREVLDTFSNMNSEVNMRPLFCSDNPIKSAIDIIGYFEKVLIASGQSNACYDALVTQGFEGACVSLAQGTPSPIAMANVVRTKTRHTLIVGDGVNQLAHLLDPADHIQQETESRSGLGGHWLVAALVVSNKGAPVCALTETQEPEDTCINSLGCRAYAEEGVGVCIAVGSRSVLSRYVLPKAVCNAVKSGHKVDEACKNVLAYVGERFNDHRTGLIVLDINGQQYSSSLAEDSVRLLSFVL